MRHGVCLFGMMFAGACTSDPQVTQPPTVQLPPSGGLHPIHQVPAGGHAMLFGGGSSFTFVGPTAPGTASYTDAPVFDINGSGMGPGQPGGGSMSITINGTSYAAPAIESATLLLGDPDGSGTDYIALDGYTTYAGPGGVTYASEVTVIVPKTDFAVNATVSLDGNDRVAMFANGPADAMEPTLVGAAITGTLTFTAGDLDTVVSGTVAGDFGQIDYVPDPPPTGTITAGSYALAVVGPAEVYCDGTLAGHEADFAGVTMADLGVGNASVAVTAPSAAVVDIAGAPGFTGVFELDDQGGGLFAGFTTETGSGPSGTTYLGKYLVFDGGSATPTFVNGGVGGGYATADGQGTCTVAFGATLTGP